MVLLLCHEGRKVQIQMARSREQSRGGLEQLLRNDFWAGHDRVYPSAKESQIISNYRSGKLCVPERRATVPRTAHPFEAHRNLNPLRNAPSCLGYKELQISSQKTQERLDSGRVPRRTGSFPANRSPASEAE
jgi:hypothetical protein